MQTTTALDSAAAGHTPYVVRISRSRTRNHSQRQTVVPSAAMHKAGSKWTVVAAFIVAVALHAGPVAWVEMQQVEPTVEANAPALTHPMEAASELGLAQDSPARTASAD